MRKPIIIKWLRLPAGNGITLWPFIIVSSKASFPERTFKHECMHWYQIQEWGVFKFYWRIIKEYFKYGQYDGPIERECYEYKKEPLLSCEQEWWYGKT
jgi:hypothetical protein